MRAKREFSLLTVSVVLAFSLVCSGNAAAQCYLSQGCQPVDDLTYQPNGTGQVYHGDGASNNAAGGWTANYSDYNQCLSCHYGTDTLPYLMSGHKNTMRKIAPGGLWGGPDGATYSTTDSYYGSGSVFNWTNGQVTLGWCDPISVISQNGVSLVDPVCQYPYYTLPNAHAPAAYSTVPQTVTAGGVRSLFYIFGGWMNYGGNSNPAATHLGTVFNGGFTGGKYPDGNFDCSRCHATGYNFDSSAPEPTQNASQKVTPIPDAQFSRIPSDGFVAPGTNGTSSWYLTGIQCERCHAAAWGYGSHPYDPVTVTPPQNEAATALCMECHRGEMITMANPVTVPPTAGSIAPLATPQTLDRGYCSDLSGSTYSICVGNSSNSWIYKPHIQHEAGPTFLNSPHARFSGTLIQNAPHSADLSITISGTYQSQFSENLADPTKNSGCTGCHDPHQSVVPAAKAANPVPNTCNNCHRLSQNIMATINHPAGPGTPFPTGAASDIPGACVVCHMQAALGSANSHLFRINANQNYSTFPTPSQLYNQQVNAPNTAPETSGLTLATFSPAVWLDVDLACGQCHVGNDGVTNSYGLTMPPGMPGAHAYTKAQLAYWAANMHAPDPSVPTPTFTPQPGTYNTPQSVTITDAMSGATIYYTTDGSMPTFSSAVYSTPISVSTTTSIRAMATYPSYPPSNVALAVYSIVLPQAPSPTFWPTPSTYSTPQSVTLSDTAGLSIYYTLDGSTPTTNSTRYTVPISVTKNTTIKAITAAWGYLTSPVSSGTYAIQAPTPTFSPAAGTYSTTQTVTISDTAGGTTIYYTTDGTFPTTSSASCANPCTLAVSATTTIKAIAAGGGYAAGNTAVAAYTIAAYTPTFSPVAGTYTGAQSVTISDATSAATIYYTTNNSFPTTSSPSCSSPCTIQISTTSTVRAMAAGNGIAQSGTAVAVYTIAANTPTFSPAAGTYTGTQSVTISDTTSGATIYYTTNNSFPTTSSPSCSSPCTFPVSTTSTIRAMAAGNGLAQSGTAVAVYTIAAATPTFSLASGTYTGAQSVTLSDSATAANIYYTTNGTYPTIYSTSCSNPCTITVSTSGTIEAMAAGGGYAASNVATANYTIK